MKRSPTALALALVVPLLAVTVAGPARADDSGAAQGGVGSAASMPQGAAAPGTSPRARGLIVKTTGSEVSVMRLASVSEQALATPASRALGALTGGAAGVASGAATVDAPAEVSVGSAISATTRVLDFSEPLPPAQAEVAAQALEARPDVVWAVPDLPMHIAAAPVIPNDPRFGEQWDLWDSGGADDFSVHAPLIWGRTKGSSSVVVAIVDTGITSHPDLNANVVPGYDFISDVDVANDGNARDPDPADPGDWITAAEDASGEFQDCGVTNSSWHGTHVAGTIAAVQDNGIGISGVAPGVRIQSVRALGKCGGYTSDIVAGIRWAVGGSVPGVPANPTPAKVVSLSLGGPGPCSAAEQDAVDFVRSRGAVMVAAAGNESQPVSTSSPADCTGVIAVAATSQNGQLAGYSNYGTAPGEVTISAPGGDMGYDAGILSTLNTGTRGPASPSYGAYRGTSMATPHVAAAAALAYSLGITGTDAVTAALTQAVQPFPRGSNPCTLTTCGAGILDLSKLTAGTPATAPGAPTAVTATAGDATAVISWTAPGDDGGSPLSTYSATATPGGARCTTLATSCTITGLSNGTTYSVVVTASNEAGFTSVGSTAASVTPTSGSAATVPGAVPPPRVTWRYGGLRATAILRWAAPLDTGGSPIDGYRARLGRAGAPYSSWTTLARAAATVDLRVGVRYRVQIQAHNASGYGATTTALLRP